jgi:protein-S-isoprenylcysteine O-methyltransferase Ste14
VALIAFDRDPSPKTLRVFGMLLAVFFALLGLLLWHRTGGFGAARVGWVAGSLVTALYFALPAVRWPFYMAWMTAVSPIGWLVSHALLVVIFYGVLLPCGLVARLFGYDPMRRRPGRRTGSTWQEIAPTRDPSRYFRQS